MTNHRIHLEVPAADAGGGPACSDRRLEMTRWECTEHDVSALGVRDGALAPTNQDVSTHTSRRVPGTVRALLAFAIGTVGLAAMLSLLGPATVALTFVGLAAIFAFLGVILELAAIPGIHAWFRSKYGSWGVETSSSVREPTRTPPRTADSAAGSIQRLDSTSGVRGIR